MFNRLYFVWFDFLIHLPVTELSELSFVVCGACGGFHNRKE
jgi:hypothetical protein